METADVQEAPGINLMGDISVTRQQERVLQNIQSVVLAEPAPPPAVSVGNADEVVAVEPPVEGLDDMLNRRLWFEFEEDCLKRDITFENNRLRMIWKRLELTALLTKEKINSYFTSRNLLPPKVIIIDTNHFTRFLSGGGGPYEQRKNEETTESPMDQPKIFLVIPKVSEFFVSYTSIPKQRRNYIELGFYYPCKFDQNRVTKYSINARYQSGVRSSKHDNNARMFGQQQLQAIENANASLNDWPIVPIYPNTQTRNVVKFFNMFHVTSTFTNGAERLLDAFCAPFVQMMERYDPQVILLRKKEMEEARKREELEAEERRKAFAIIKEKQTREMMAKLLVGELEAMKVKLAEVKKKYSRSIEEAQKYYAEFLEMNDKIIKKDVSDATKKYIEEINEVFSLCPDRYERFEISQTSPGTLIGISSKVILTLPSGEEWDCGQYAVCAGFKDNTLKVWRMNNGGMVENDQSAYHPHVLSGSCCLGNIQTEVWKSIQERRIFALFFTMRNFLESWNANSTYRGHNPQEIPTWTRISG